ncbi:MAG: GlsB/YeaQ/YmgE family stress response membrane protein [Desulfobacterales bacterium]|nr:MAG: GlsB/YeaQ/YmgE family stress response membrane protein [Desulfobacterales bacterium]
MGVLSWIILGLIVGIIAKFVIPGKDPGGIFITIILGIAGAFVGGFIGSALGLGSVTGFDIRSLLIAVGGSILLLIVYRAIKKEK